MSNLNENLKPLSKLNPFGRFCVTIGHLPTSYMESLTYEEQLIWFCEYLEKTVIPAINNNAEATEEVQNLFIELKSYVDNYFENLDVQEEINNKLDEMAESGDLAEIISQYLESQAIIAFNNISDLQNTTSLANGSFAKTYGKTTYNDGLGAFYKIRTLTNQDVVDGDNIIELINTENLVAEKIRDLKIDNLEELVTTPKDYYIIIGDSYALNHGNTENFVDLFKTNMNLTDNQIFSNAVGGIGFCNVINNKTFLTLLQELTNNMTDTQKSLITKIVVECGINDANHSADDIYNKIEEFNTYVKNNFPKAKFYIYAVGRSANPANNLNIINNVYSAISRAQAIGVININGAENVMHYYELFQSDNYHPTNLGSAFIARFLSEGLQTGNINPKYNGNALLSQLFTPTKQGTSLGAININTELFNGVCKLSSEDSIFIGLDDVDITGNLDITIGYMNSYNNKMCAHPWATKMIIPITGYLVGTQNGSWKNNIPLKGNLYFAYNSTDDKYELRLRFSRYYANNQVTACNGLQIDMFSSVANAEYC